MAPAAASTLMRHLTDLKRDASYYDLILTGDLGCVGGKIFQDYLETNYGVHLKNYLDAGCELFLDMFWKVAFRASPSVLGSHSASG